MSPRQRRIVQALCYEAIAIAVVGPLLSAAFGEGLSSSMALAALLSAIALAWNYVFNGLFEHWETRQPTRTRTLRRRLWHGIGFEGGLGLLLVPVMAWWLQISLLAALLADLGLLVFFFFYAIGFTWAFDRLFGPPLSAREPASAPSAAAAAEP